MPTYELSCNGCGHVFEVFLTRILRDGDRVCPECDSADVRVGVGGGVLGAGTSAGGHATYPGRGSCGTGSGGFG